MTKYIVSAIYDPTAGFDLSLSPDRVIERAVGKESDGSGCGFGERELYWYYKRVDAAVRTLKRLETVRRRHKDYCLKIQLYNDEAWNG